MWFGLSSIYNHQICRSYTHLIPDVCSCHVLRILAVAVSKIGNVCFLPAPAHQPFFLIVWILVLLKKRIEEMYAHRVL